MNVGVACPERSELHCMELPEKKLALSELR